MAGTTGLLTIPALAAEPGLAHAFSTTALGSMRRTEAELLTPARRAFAARLGLDGDLLTVAGAVHGVEVSRVDAAQGAVEGVDGLVTDRPGLALLATYADCYPLLVYDPRQHAVGLAHAGWRGTAAGMAGALVAALVREYGSRPSDLVAGIGPGICGRCYQVGGEVAARFNGFSRPDPEGRFRLDLAAANRAQLEAAGIPVGRVHVLGTCTFESADLPSHRRRPDGARFACLVALR
ncbi:MAG TPA: polyphenol oxidase family protein [Candidatus Dormibacteraeota bacterium]